MARSLVVTRLSPFPANAGVPRRVAANLAGLSELGPVDLLIIDDEPAGEIPEYISSVESFPHLTPKHGSGRLARLGPMHPLAASLFDAEVEAAIERMGAGPGLIVFEEVWMAPYLEAAARTGRQIVYDSHNVETTLRRQIASIGKLGPAKRLRREIVARQVKRLEQDLIRGSDQVWVCSEQDRIALDELFGSQSHVRVVPNCVDTDAISTKLAEPMQRPPEFGGGRPSIIFLGYLAYVPNEDGALHLLNDVMPAVRHQVPDALVLFVGRRPTGKLIAAASGDDRAIVTGEVPEVEPYLVAGDVLAVTLRVGGGTRLKILEAMAAGMPIVTTSKGLEGIDARHGEHLLIADEPDDIAEAIVQVLADPERARELADRALELVEQSYSWKTVAHLIAEAAAELDQA